MALTETYVDPAIAANSGTGTSVDPYGDLQYALDTMTRDATNGDRLNIKAGTAEVMASAISLATYGTPTAAAPLVIQGYTSAAGDGGIGEINNGGANVSVFNSSTLDHIHFIDMKLGNTGTAQIVRTDDYSVFVNVEFHASSAAGAVQVDANAQFHRCRFTATGNNMVFTGTGARIDHCYFSYGVASSQALVLASNSTLTNSIFSLTGSASGVSVSGDTPVVIGNSFYASAGTGAAIKAAATLLSVKNNIITGFSGVGGKGIALTSGLFAFLGANAYYNNTTNEDSIVAIYAAANITLTNAPFTNAGGGDFSIATAAKTELQSQGWPSSFLGISTNQYLDPGAAQIQPSSGGAFAVMGGLIVR